jgi:hypothetical protein
MRVQLRIVGDRQPCQPPDGGGAAACYQIHLATNLRRHGVAVALNAAIEAAYTESVTPKGSRPCDHPSWWAGSFPLKLPAAVVALVPVRVINVDWPTS